MARDTQAALVALNRFGFGARGGVSGDLINASSDPRGFVKAELARPNGVLLEAPGLQSTPQLGQAVFAYQDQVNKRLKKNYNLPVLFFTQLMGLAFGLNEEDLHLQTCVVRPEKALVKYL